MCDNSSLSGWAWRASNPNNDDVAACKEILVKPRAYSLTLPRVFIFSDIAWFIRIFRKPECVCGKQDLNSISHRENDQPCSLLGLLWGASPWRIKPQPPAGWLSTILGVPSLPWTGKWKWRHCAVRASRGSYWWLPPINQWQTAVSTCAMG